MAATGNNVLLQVFDGLRANLLRVAMLSRHSDLREGDVIWKEHRDMAAALKAHDWMAALELLECHLPLMPQLVPALST
ncbi:FCD domain-containing protein [uncultured Jannaschia sp.]|uniref:FCD domain-containing protein n=1 Tax=uncultured Jannaschia sp. TaxID=293347 RepID=UPI00261F1EBC|nr:FCD domain-containing protein [uncultured Jannaschia sp.]